VFAAARDKVQDAMTLGVASAEATDTVTFSII
jgi:hypothetical protein